MIKPKQIEQDQITPLPVPAYSSFFYGSIYGDLNRSLRYDSRFSCLLRSMFQYNRLVTALLHELRQNQRVLQMGAVFGREIDEVAMRVGAYGQIDVIDINSLQVSRNREKYGDIYPGLQFICADAATYKSEEKYDCVICFMLLQELPPVTKSKVINNALNLVKDGGNVIFIDHHSPYWWNPLRYFIRMYNRLYNPFVEKLWDRGIETFAKNKFDYIWRKSTYFGGIYQKVVATKKTGPLEGMQDPEPHKDNFFFED